MYRTTRQERQIQDTIASFFRTNMSPFAVADVALRQYVDVVKHTDITTANDTVIAGIRRGDICKIGAYWMHPGILNMLTMAYTMSVVGILCKQIGINEDAELYHQIMSDFTTPDYLVSVQRAIIQMAQMNNLRPDFNQAIADLVYQNAVTKLLA